MIKVPNNFYGQIVTPDGLQPVLKAVEVLLGPGRASLFRSRSSSTVETLRIRTDAADLETLPLPGGIDYLLNGSVTGPAEDVTAFVRSLSAGLARAGVEHSFQVHDGRRVVLSLPE